MKKLTYSCYPVYKLTIWILMLLLIPLGLLSIIVSALKIPKMFWKDLEGVRSRFKYLRWESSHRTYIQMKEIWKI